MDYIKIAKEIYEVDRDMDDYNDEPVKIVIQTQNEAFQNGNREYQLARILKKLANDIENGTKVKKLLDINGNVVGVVTGV